MKQAFRTLVSQMPADGTLVAAVNHAGVRDVVAGAPCRVVGYGPGDEGAPAWRARRIAVEAGGTGFDVERPGGPALRVTAPMFGAFNVENALAALATVGTLGVPLEEAAPALERFRGVKRRQEVRGEVRGVLVLDDFAHHPTAVSGTVGAVRARFPGRRIVAVFEPRTNTSRRAVFQADYVQALRGADRVVIAEPPPGAVYSATGRVTEFLSVDAVARELRAAGVEAEVLPGADAIAARLAASCAPGDVVLVMSNGGFGNVWEKLLEALAGRH